MSASVDSVLRFYAAWWTAAGPLLYRLAGRFDRDRTTLLEVCGVTFLGGVARVMAARHSGQPHALFRVLTAVELVIPPIALALHHRRDT